MVRQRSQNVERREKQSVEPGKLAKWRVLVIPSLSLKPAAFLTMSATGWLVIY